MKIIIAVFLIVNFSNMTYSQAIHITNNMYFANDCEIKDDVVYYTTSGGELAKFNLNTPGNKTFPGITSFAKLFLNDTDLYIANSNNRIIKIDLADSNLSTNEIVTDLDDPNDIVLLGNSLYIAEKNKLSLIDISNLSKTKVIINENINIRGLALYNDQIYLSEPDRISKLNQDNSVSTIISNIDPRGIEIINNILFFSDENTKKIFSVNLEDINYSKSTIVENVENVHSLKYYEGNLYFSQYDLNNFFKIDVSNTTLSTNNIINSKKDNLFYIKQNKSKNRLELINYNETPYSIFNIQGKTIIESSTNEYINFNEYNLRRGLYILKNNHQSFKFIIE